ncbi:hypothetical protein KPATCC21470_6692 [Kitasatospora purpeofusca]
MVRCCRHARPCVLLSGGLVSSGTGSGGPVSDGRASGVSPDSG